MKSRSLRLFTLFILCVGILQAQSNYTTAYTFTTLAGAAGITGSTDGKGGEARFFKPAGLAVDAAGNVYVADTDNSTIRKVTSAGVVTTLAGSAGSYGTTDGTGSAARFGFPTGVAVDGTGNVYVADDRYSTIRKVTSAGVVTTIAGSAGLQGANDGTGSVARFNYPCGVAVDSAGNLYVSDNINWKIRKVTSAGVVTTLAGSSVSYGSNDGTGSAAKFHNSYGVAVDNTGNVYVADSGNNTIRKVTSTGLVTTMAGMAGRGGTTDGTGSAARFNYPHGVAVDSAGNLYVADTDNSIIRKVTSAGVVTTLAGSPSVTGSANGTGSAALFNFPAGVAVDGAGNVYVADTSNHIIRKGVPAPTQTITFPSLPNRILSDSPITLAATASSGLTPTFAIVSGSATLNKNVVTLTAAGVVTIRADQDGGGVYAPALSVDQSFSVNVSQTITFPSLANQSFSNVPIILTATASSGFAPTYKIVAGAATLSGNTVILTGAGVVTIRAEQNGGGVYAPAPSVDRSFTVTQASQTITFPIISDRLFSKAGIALAATASSGRPVTYSVVSGPATISGSILTMTDAGRITVRAVQAGDTNYAAAAAAVSFTVTPNNVVPASLTLSRNWFYDNVPIRTQIGFLSAVDSDTGDQITYSLVTGAGATDNAKFSIVGGVLSTAYTNFSYATQGAQSVRVRATDLAGQYTEQSFALNVVPGSLNATFELKAGFTEAPPSYVNVIFQVKDSTGRGLNLPRELLDQTNIFQVKENGAALSPSESFLQVAKFGEVPSKVRTILLLDNSFSVGANLATIKTAAKALVERMFAEQEIAVYSFSSTHTLVKDFTGKSTADQQALKAAIDSITLGAPTTNLYGSILQMLSLPQWKESFSLSGIETGFLVVMTDGSDQAGLATLSDVVAKRDGEKKQIFTLGLGAEIDVAALRSLGNAGYIPAAQVSDLVTAFATIQTNIEYGSNSFYWLNYASPKRGDFTRTLTVSLANNTNTTPAGTLTYSFNSKLFSDVTSAVVINRNVNNTWGASSLTLSNDASSVARAFTMLPPQGPPAYTWSIADGSLATVVPSGADGSRVTITAKGVDGATSLTLTDTVNRTSRTIPLLIGTGTAPTSSRLINLSILTSITDQGESFTLGYVVGGTGTIGTKPLVIRAAGPSLGALGVEGTLADPMIELFSGAIRSGENDNWGGSSAISSAMAGVGAFPFSGPASRDAATSLSVATRDNSVKVSAAGTGTGAVIAEIYDASPTGTINSTTPRLINVSVLKQLGEVLTAGFVVGGTGTKTVLIRAIGPGLSAFGIGGIVSDPKLELFDGSSKRIGLNDNWGGTPALIAAFASVGAFGLDASSKDAAIVTPLQPGNYSVQVSGIAGTTGTALVEIYEVP